MISGNVCRDPKPDADRMLAAPGPAKATTYRCTGLISGIGSNWAGSGLAAYVTSLGKGDIEQVSALLRPDRSEDGRHTALSLRNGGVEMLAFMSAVAIAAEPTSGNERRPLNRR